MQKKTRVYDFKYVNKGLAYYMGQEYYAEGRINGRKYMTSCVFNGYTKKEAISQLKDWLRMKAAQSA